MLRTRWHKVLRDIWGNRSRTILVVLSIAIGIFGVGMISSTRAILSRELNASYAAADPASAVLFTDPFDDDLVQSVRRMPEVGEAEGRRSLNVRLILGPDEERALALIAIPDYADIRINQARPEQGAWPPPKRELLIERASINYAGANLGDTLLIETPDGRQREMRVAGVAHDLTQAPPFLAGTAYGYITFDTLEWLGEERDFSELNIIVAGDTDDKQTIQDVADQVADKVEDSGRRVHFTLVPEPGMHPVDTFLKPMLLLLGVLGFLSLLLSGFLVVNTISAVLMQQTRQIGVMKAVGARTRQVTNLYLGMVLIFALLALVVALPLGALAARAFTNLIAGSLNVDITNFNIPPQVLLLELGVGLIVPLLAALYPVKAGTRITVNQAISAYGLGKGRLGTSLIDRLIGATVRLSRVPRPLLLSLRNTFRRKGRLALTLMTLTLAGAIFIGVFSVRASLLHTLDIALEYWQYDVEVNFSRPQRIERIERETLRVPGVVAAESWAFNMANRLRPDDTESDTIFIIAPPAETQMLKPIILEGRWLLPEDDNAVVINTEVLKTEPDVHVGDEILLDIEQRETTWRVVGIVQGVMTGPIAYTNYPYFTRVTHGVGRAGRVQVVTERHDADFQAQVAKALEERYEQAGMRVSSTTLTSDLRARLVQLFDIIVALLSVTAVLLAAVGALGLMGTMSINVLERTREIGVMRAVGASDGAVQQIVIVEGILIGMLSWLIGGLVAFPLSKLLSSAVGMALMQTSLSYVFSTGGALLWLVIVIILAALSSFLPARAASRLTVREVLAYE